MIGIYLFLHLFVFGVKCFNMSVNPLLSHFNQSVIGPLVKRGSEAYCATKSLGKRVYQVGAAAFSGIGNWPFYGVADTFGKSYSSGFGSWLGACEFGSYFTFRLRNFEEIRQKFFGGSDSEMAAPAPIEPDDEADLRVSLIPAERQGVHSGNSPDSGDVRRACSSRFNCRDIAFKTGVAALGMLAQFPLMVLVYQGNGENIVYPIITGLCEASFTILSLWLTLKSPKKPKVNEELNSGVEGNRKRLIAKINAFLEVLPSKFNDPVFAGRVEEIFASSSQQTEEERGMALLHLVVNAEGLSELEKGSWDGTLSPIAKGLGLLISLYLTTVNGAVSYQGVKDWRNDQEALAILTTVLVSLANIKLLNKVCVDSATSYYEGLRDLIKGQYRPPLAHAVSPKAWCIGRAVSTVLSWFSFGTTAIGARDYIPKAGKGLIAPAPLSSALLLNENMNWSADDFLLWAHSKCDPKVERFSHVNDSLLRFREIIENADPEILQTFLDSFPNFRASLLQNASSPDVALQTLA
jgi:hypothetical protein